MLKWEKPELTILSRGRPEERVLKAGNCKHPHTIGGPGSMNQDCDELKGVSGCGACKANNGGS